MNNTKTLSKINLSINSEFAHELVLAIPYAYYLHKNKKLGTVTTSKDMKPFYYFCDSVIESFENRTIVNSKSGLNQLPNNWIHHNAMGVFGKDYGDLSTEEKCLANGVLDYSQWIAPPYKEIYTSNIIEKPYVVVNNTYNIEFGELNRRPLRTFDIKCLYYIFVYLQENGYNVVYKRPKNTEFTTDENEVNSISMGRELSSYVDGFGKMSDYDLCNHFNNVYLLDDLLDGKSYNEQQLKIFSSADAFITPNGGGGVLCSYFGKPVIMYVPDGKEKRPGYLTNESSYIKKLSNSKVYPVFDNPLETGVSNYKDVFKTMKEILKG
jgi:hypothetical protein